LITPLTACDPSAVVTTCAAAVATVRVTLVKIAYRALTPIVVAITVLATCNARQIEERAARLATYSSVVIALFSNHVGTPAGHSITPLTPSNVSAA
jgi:hypothetical protein